MKRQSALLLNGSSDYVEVADHIDLKNKSFTIEFWAKRNQIDQHGFIIGQGTTSTNQGLHIGFLTNQFLFAFYGNSIKSSEVYTDKNWHHWANVYDSSTRTLQIYRDGVLVEEGTVTSHYQGSGPLVIGKCTWGIILMVKLMK